MKKLLVYLDEDFHADLKELARRKNTSMGALVRYAVDLTFEDDLDEIAADSAIAEMLAHPEDVITLDEYLERRGIVLPSKRVAESDPRPAKIADERGEYSVGTDSGSGGRSKAKTNAKAKGHA